MGRRPAPADRGPAGAPADRGPADRGADRAGDPNRPPRPPASREGGGQGRPGMPRPNSAMMPKSPAAFGSGPGAPSGGGRGPGGEGTRVGGGQSVSVSIDQGGRRTIK